jgi:hypothetical protein
MASFRIKGVDPTPFRDLYNLPDAELASRGAFRYVATDGSAHPDRIELRHARAGETVLLVNYVHQPAASPYRASHAIYVLEGATTPAEFTDVVPEPLRTRILSLRAFDERHMMIDAALADGKFAEDAITKLFENPATAYIHAHFATRGCYAAYIERAS